MKYFSGAIFAYRRRKEICIGCRHLGISSTGSYVCVKCCNDAFVSRKPEEFDGMDGEWGLHFPEAFEGNGVPPDCPRRTKHENAQRLEEL